MMTGWSGQQWYPEAPYVSAAASASTLEMTAAEKQRARRKRPVGFAPPVAPAPKRKPRAKSKARAS